MSHKDPFLDVPKGMAESMAQTEWMIAAEIIRKRTYKNRKPRGQRKFT